MIVGNGTCVVIEKCVKTDGTSNYCHTYYTSNLYTYIFIGILILRHYMDAYLHLTNCYAAMSMSCTLLFMEWSSKRMFWFRIFVINVES